MKNDRTLSNPAKLSIESYISPSELRGAHNFARAAQPIMSLELQTEPPPLRQERQEVHHPAAEDPVQSTEVATNAIPETDFLIETRLADPEPQFRPPSSWRNAEPSPNSERHWHWSERSTAAFLGFAAGVLIIVPLVFFLSMTSDQHMPKAIPEATDPPVAAALAPAKPVIVASVSAGSWFDSRTTKTVETTEATETTETKLTTATTDPVADRSDEPADQQVNEQEAENRARKALAAGRVIEARAVLRIAASPDTPRLWFVLAETYDPLVGKQRTQAGANPAAQTGTPDQLMAADIKFARFYYRQALTHGISAARARLAALAQP